MKMMMAPIVDGALGTVPRKLEKTLAVLEIRGRIETIQTTALLKSDRILRRVLENREDSNETQPIRATGKSLLGAK